MTSAVAPHVVVLVRQWHDHHGAGGCCGSTEALSGLLPPAATCDPGGADPGARAATGTGELYRELRRRLPEVGITVADSRNWLWLVPSTYRAVRARGASRGEAARAASRATTPGAVLVDGDLLDVLRDEPAGEVAARVVARLRGRSGTLPV